MFLCPPYLMNDGMMIMTSSTYSSEALIVSTKAKLKALMVIYDCIALVSIYVKKSTNI